jgi:ribonuclease P protein component
MATQEATPHASARLSAKNELSRRTPGGVRAPGQGPQAPHSVVTYQVLRDRRTFRRVTSSGESAGGAFARVIWLLNGLDHNRYGVAATTAVGGSVQRNKVRRWSREYFRRWDPELAQGNDIVVMANRKGAADDFTAFGESLIKSLCRARLAAVGTLLAGPLEARDVR